MGARQRLSADGIQVWTQDSEGIPEAVDRFDFFGASVAAGDFNADGYADLAIGVPNEGVGVGDVTDFSSCYGIVHVLYGGAFGLSAAGNQVWSQDSPGIEDAVEKCEFFGQSLLAANFGMDSSSDCFDDLVIGVPAEIIGTALGGAVHVLYGSSAGLSAAASQFWHQDTPGIPGVAAELDFDRFGASLAGGTFRAQPASCGGGNLLSDLVVGAPFKGLETPDS